MMKLAFCLFKYYPYGGLERDFLQIAKVCLARGHEVHVFTMSWEGEIPTSFHVKFIKPFGFSNAGRAKSFSNQVARHLKKQNFDRVIGFNRMPNLDFYFAGDPCFAKSAQEKHPLLFKLLPRYRIYANFENSVFSPQSKTQILLLNPTHLDVFREYYKTPKKRFTLLAPGINEDRRRPLNQTEIREQFRKKYDVPPDDKIILMVGSDFKRKGIDRALLAFDALPNFIKDSARLWIVGQGEPIAHPRVTYWGARNDIVNFYAAADCLLHVAYQETAGMVLLESLAAGLPVVVTQNCGYAPYIQKASAGMIVPEPFAQETLNQILTKVLSEEDVLADYRQNALNFCKTHNLFHFAIQIAMIIEGKA